MRKVRARQSRKVYSCKQHVVYFEVISGYSFILIYSLLFFYSNLFVIPIMNFLSVFSPLSRLSSFPFLFLFSAFLEPTRPSHAVPFYPRPLPILVGHENHLLRAPYSYVSVSAVDMWCWRVCAHWTAEWSSSTTHETKEREGPRTRISRESNLGRACTRDALVSQ